MSKVLPDECGWETASQTQQYADAHVVVMTEQVKTPARPHLKSWTTVFRKSAVVIAAMTRDEKLLLVRQERIPIRCMLWEVPAGQIDEENPGQQEIEATVLRELREETGHQLAPGGELVPLGDFFASPGFTNEREYMFVARPVEPTGDKRIEDESIIDCRAFSIAELQAMIARNEIRDANTLSICARLGARGWLGLRVD